MSDQPLHIPHAAAATRGNRAHVRRLAAAAAAMSTVGALVAFAAPANAAAGPRAALKHGILTVSGTTARDVIDVVLNADNATVDFGFDGTIDAQFPRTRIKAVRVLGAAGDDGLSVRGLGVGEVPITISGGPGNDAAGVVGFEDPLLAGDAPVTITGDDGNDNLSASVPGDAPVGIDAAAGDDIVFGGDGSIGPETISLGDGNDKFVSTFDVFASPFRTRSDAVDGGTGRDVLELRGTFESETVDLSADAGQLIVQHDQGRVDADNVEDVTWTGFGGLDETGFGDQVTVNDLSSTTVATFTANFTDPLDNTGPNNSFDVLRVVGTPGDDHITASGSASTITVSGLTPLVTAVDLDGQDTLAIDTLDGDDVVDSSGLEPGLVQLLVR